MMVSMTVMTVVRGEREGCCPQGDLRETVQ